MTVHPPVHLGPGPGPGERVGIEAVVLGPAGIEMLDEVGAAGPVASLKIARPEGAQQQFGLVEPGGMGRSEEHYQRTLAALARKVSSGIGVFQ